MTKRLCPICGKMLTETDSTFLFCSERCRSVDLGRWLGERYRIVTDLPADVDEAVAAAHLGSEE